jgi:hypothetical protein
LRRASSVLALCLVVVALSGCGSSDSSYPSLGSQTPEAPPTGGEQNGWVTIGGGTFALGSDEARVTAVTVDPRRVRLQVNASPDVDTETSYEVHCDTGSTRGEESGARTPLTRELELPRATAASKGVQCSISARATKPPDASMTVTLLVPGTAKAAAQP